MEQTNKKYLSTSKHYLSQKTWRFLRHVIPLGLWNFLYASRQRLLLKKLESLIADMVSQYSKSGSEKGKNTGKIAAAIMQNDESVKKEAAILEKLFTEYESDKCVLHNYNYLYGALFKDIKDSASRVMEVGTYKGASLRSWKSYFTTAEIYGIDIDPDTVFVEPRINTMLADQNKIDSLGNVNKTWQHKYDVVIDDGWHQPEASVFTMLAFVPQLGKGGIYVLEDIDQEKYHTFYKNIMNMVNESDDFYAEYIDLPACVPSTGSGYNYGVLVIKKL